MRDDRLHPFAESDATRMDLERLMLTVGQAIMRFYTSESFQTADKMDGSPVTSADLAANELIHDGLSRMTPYLPIVSEEGFDPAVDRRQMEAYWLVDPLDGTKEFIKHSDEFTVNIALIWRQRSVAGLVYCPAKELLYSAWNGRLYKNREAFEPGYHSPTTVSEFVALCSESHRDPHTEAFLAERTINAKSYLGSSLKFCRLLDGAGDFYIRYTPTSEWDTAAGQAICETAGFQCLSLPDLTPLEYSKPDIRNPPFVVAKPEVVNRLFPDS